MGLQGLARLTIPPQAGVSLWGCRQHSLFSSMRVYVVGLLQEKSSG